MPNNPVQIEVLSLSGNNITAIGNHLYINGVNAIAGISGSSPSTSLLTIPVSINTFGGLTNLMGMPDGWISIPISGITYKMPFYK